MLPILCVVGENNTGNMPAVSVESLNILHAQLVVIYKLYESSWCLHRCHFSFVLSKRSISLKVIHDRFFVSQSAGSGG